MASLALIKAGYGLTNPVLGSALYFLTNSVDPNGCIDSSTIETALGLLPLCAAYYQTPASNQPPLVAVITAMRSYLISAQFYEDGTINNVDTNDPSYGAFSDDWAGEADLMGTQVALSAIKAADGVLSLSATDTYTRALVFVQNCEIGTAPAATCPAAKPLFMP